MYTGILFVIWGLFSNSLCKPLNENEKLLSTESSSQEEKKTHLNEELISRAAIGASSREQSSTSNPLAPLQNLFGNGQSASNSQSSNPIGSIPPVMVLGMHQAILVPLNALPEIFQNMLTGIFNTGNLQQGISLIPNIPNVMG